jgi:hypothetical protein
MTQIMDGPRVEDLQLTPGSIIEGVVLARSSNEPIADAIVSFQDGRHGNTGGGRTNISSDGRMVRTDENGRFRLAWPTSRLGRPAPRRARPSRSRWGSGRR